MVNDDDQAARDAERLLPCLKRHFEQYDVGFSAVGCDVCSKRPAVAAALRERDKRIAELRDKIRIATEQAE